MIYNVIGNAELRTPRFVRQMQRLYDRYDLLCEACRNVKWAAQAIRECREAEQAENLAALEQVGDALARDRDATQAKLEQMESLEQAALARDEEYI